MMHALTTLSTGMLKISMVTLSYTLFYQAIRSLKRKKKLFFLLCLRMVLLSMPRMPQVRITDLAQTWDSCITLYAGREVTHIVVESGRPKASSVLLQRGVPARLTWPGTQWSLLHVACGVLCIPAGGLSSSDSAAARNRWKPSTSTVQVLLAVRLLYEFSVPSHVAGSALPH
jgi:hypothetical protein